MRVNAHAIPDSRTLFYKKKFFFFGGPFDVTWRNERSPNGGKKVFSFPPPPPPPQKKIFLYFFLPLFLRTCRNWNFSTREVLKHGNEGWKGGQMKLSPFDWIRPNVRTFKLKIWCKIRANENLEIRSLPPPYEGRVSRGGGKTFEIQICLQKSIVG